MASVRGGELSLRKPRLRLADNAFYRWQCSDAYWTSLGTTPEEAYLRWSKTNPMLHGHSPRWFEPDQFFKPVPGSERAV